MVKILVSNNNGILEYFLVVNDNNKGKLGNMWKLLQGEMSFSLKSGGNRQHQQQQRAICGRSGQQQQ
uniref:Uncharacterized protein n=1 Tax=Meloidogyne incognita TaxID=6306 RepID=A0A914L439_MELIC